MTATATPGQAWLDTLTGDARAATAPALLEVFVPGRPAPQGSKRHVGRGILVESSKACGPWRQTVAVFARQAYDGPPLDGPLAVRIEFVMPRPANLPKRRATPPMTKKPDTDKLARAILDALTSVVWRDDSQIVDLHPTKRYAEIGETPGARIRVAPHVKESAA